MGSSILAERPREAELFLWHNKSGGISFLLYGPIEISATSHLSYNDAYILHLNCFQIHCLDGVEDNIEKCPIPKWLYPFF